MVFQLLIFSRWFGGHTFNFKRTQSWEVHGPHRSLWRAVAALGAAAVVGLRAAHLAAASLVWAVCTVGNAVAHQGRIQALLAAATLELVREARHRSTW